jgi:hypothetical protein
MNPIEPISDRNSMDELGGGWGFRTTTTKSTLGDLTLFSETTLLTYLLFKSNRGQIALATFVS